ncbi:ERO1-like protein beta isoform X2 [Xenia sp. Carnegie-2017]|uniref:ERO1-like protein beta isoform X2 n=1 Tax=Xenia sp. Carnegie-2017 TaxID=2897299 RepID=UPI001F03752E|nr:ERO1-like protein beta isoform X2 [Xenia sp. Carnegie-2017]
MKSLLCSTVLFVYFAPLYSRVKYGLHEDKCFCELSGKVEDCCCDVEAVNSLNKEVFKRITEIVNTNYFKFYKVNLARSCPYWHDDNQCSLKDCSVQTCKEEEVPEGVKGHYMKDESKDCYVENSTLGDVNIHLSEEDKQVFATWQQYDDAEDSFCYPEDELSADSKYVNLLLNPERFTNYKGPSANRVWHSIYNENCFKVTNPYTDKYQMNSMLNQMCLEKRVFYRVISGMHASINTHLSALYLFKGNGFFKPVWAPNANEFKRRFDPEKTNGQGPSWLKNIYFLYLLVWRAIVKAGPYWKQEGFYTGNSTEDELVKKHVEDLLSQARSCPSTFDESIMFTGDPIKSKGLKEEFRKKFRNITRIMDCVGCQKCRLWGKVQTQGIGTALKILFSRNQLDESTVASTFRLKRNEIVALFNALGRYSSSIHYVQMFRSLSKT